MMSSSRPTLQGPPVQCSISIEDDPKEILRFESFQETLGESYTTSWTLSGQRGLQSQSLYAYYGGGQFSSFQLVLDFVAGLHKNINPVSGSSGFGSSGGTDRESQFLELEKKVRWCQALCFPKPEVPVSKKDAYYVTQGKPPRVLVTIGSFLTILGVVNSCNISWNGPWDPDMARPGSANVTMGIDRLNTYYPDWYDVRGLVGYRKTTMTPERAAELRNYYLNSVNNVLSYAGSGAQQSTGATPAATPLVPAVVSTGSFTRPRGRTI